MRPWRIDRQTKLQAVQPMQSAACLNTNCECYLEWLVYFVFMLLYVKWWFKVSQCCKQTKLHCKCCGHLFDRKWSPVYSKDGWCVSSEWKDLQSFLTRSPCHAKRVQPLISASCSVERGTVCVAVCGEHLTLSLPSSFFIPAWLGFGKRTHSHMHGHTHTQSDISVLSCGSSLTVFLASLPGLPLYLLSVCDLSLTPVTPQLGSSRCALLGFVEIPLLSQ